MARSPGCRSRPVRRGCDRKPCMRGFRSDEVELTCVKRGRGIPHPRRASTARDVDELDFLVTVPIPPGCRSRDSRASRRPVKDRRADCDERRAALPWSTAVRSSHVYNSQRTCSTPSFVESWSRQAVSLIDFGAAHGLYCHTQLTPCSAHPFRIRAGTRLGTAPRSRPISS